MAWWRSFGSLLQLRRSLLFPLPYPWYGASRRDALAATDLCRKARWYGGAHCRAQCNWSQAGTSSKQECLRCSPVEVSGFATCECHLRMISFKVSPKVDIEGGRLSAIIDRVPSNSRPRPAVAGTSKHIYPKHVSRSNILFAPVEQRMVEQHWTDVLESHLGVKRSSARKGHESRFKQQQHSCLYNKG